jgi:hypothetical protein
MNQSYVDDDNNPSVERIHVKETILNYWGVDPEVIKMLKSEEEKLLKHNEISQVLQYFDDPNNPEVQFSEVILKLTTNLNHLMKIHKRAVIEREEDDKEIMNKFNEFSEEFIKLTDTELVNYQARNDLFVEALNMGIIEDIYNFRIDVRDGRGNHLKASNRELLQQQSLTLREELGSPRKNLANASTESYVPQLLMG